MREEWQISRLQDLCEQMNGIWKGVKEPFVTAKILRTTNFSKECQLKLDDLAIIEVEKKKMDARRLRKGDIVVEKSGGGPKQPVGRAILFNIDDTDFSFCNFTSTLRVKDSTKILPEYLHKYLTYLYFSGATEKYQSNLVGFRNLDFKGYVSMEIKYPSIEEQKRLLVIINKEFEIIDALKANVGKKLSNAQSLFQSALKKELDPRSGWSESILVDVARIINGRAYSKEELLSEGKYRVLRVGNFFTNDNWYYSDLELDNEKYCENGDLLYAWSASFGPKIWDGERVIYHYHIWKVQPSEQIDKMFLYYWLQSYQLTSQVMSKLHGTTMVHITKGIMESTTISFPSKERQQIIASKLNCLYAKCESLRNQYERTIDLCNDLKQALLRKAFNGEL